MLPPIAAWRLLLGAASVAAVLGGVACGTAESTGSPPPASDGPAKPSANAAEPWRFGPTLRKRIPTGTTVRPLLELTRPDVARLHIVAAVGDAQGLRVELWSWEQTAERDVLEPQGDPEPALAMQATQPRPAALESLSLWLAAPGNGVQRPMGLEASGPQPLLQTLAAAAKTVRNESAPIPARVEALQRVWFGVDDRVMFYVPGLARTLDDLAAGKWNATSTRQISTRRHELTLADGRRLEVAKKGGGWAVTDVRPAPATGPE